MNTSLIAAFFSAQVGRLQIAVAARLARMDTDGVANNASSIKELLNAAQQNAQPLAKAAAGLDTGLGTNLDITV